ncbi:hypothetical protein B5P43_23170 [Bacillus sp. SRB_336]|nr:hypothetical protein B5P43_23170 [Bacillus sp. SRB_336]
MGNEVSNAPLVHVCQKNGPCDAIGIGVKEPQLEYFRVGCRLADPPVGPNIGTRLEKGNLRLQSITNVIVICIVRYDSHVKVLAKAPYMVVEVANDKRRQVIAEETKEDKTGLGSIPMGLDRAD